MDTEEDRQAQGTSRQALSNTSLALGHWFLSLYPHPTCLPLLCMSWLCLGREASKDKMAWTK